MKTRPGDQEFVDATLYPEVRSPARTFQTDDDRGEYLQRVCAAWDFGIPPDAATLVMLSSWRRIFDRWPLPSSASFHALRYIFGWPRVLASKAAGLRGYQLADAREGRDDPVEDLI